MIKKYTAQGIDLLVDESDERVFHPHPITHLLANAIRIKPTDTVLEVGCGSGFIAMTAAKLGAKHVYASDIAEPAVQATIRNKRLNGIDGQMQVLRGDLLEPFTGMVFDLVVANPPCMPFPNGAIYVNIGLSLAVNGGVDGSELLCSVIRQCHKFLKDQGRLLIPVPKWSNWRNLLKVTRVLYNSKVVARYSMPYYLSQWSRDFEAHMEVLVRKGLASRSGPNDRNMFEILAIECTKRQQDENNHGYF